jgi:predicted SAM-dependent methyltransferase
MEDGIRINLGAGARHLAGFVNVDLANNWTSIQPDVACDVTGPLPFPTDHADEVHAYHVFEHILRFKAEECLKEWIRILKPGGLLVLEMPCMDKIVTYMAHCLIDGRPMDPRFTMWGLYGDQKYKSEAMCHRWCYGVRELGGMLEAAGMVEITEEEPKTHQKVRDMRMTARKPDGDGLREP